MDETDGHTKCVNQPNVIGSVFYSFCSVLSDLLVNINKKILIRIYLNSSI